MCDAILLGADSGKSGFICGADWGRAKRTGGTGVIGGGGVPGIVGVECADAGRNEEQILVGSAGGFEGVGEVSAVGPLLQDYRDSRLELLPGGVGAQAGKGKSCPGINCLTYFTPPTGISLLSRTTSRSTLLSEDDALSSCT